MKRFLLLIGLSMTLSVWAADPQPEQQQGDEAVEPEVTIVETDKGTVHEYRANGHIYMVKVIPHSGAPYYLLDTNGDGELDTRQDDVRNVATPQWVLFRW